MPLDAQEVHRIAVLARLRLNREEELRFAEQLGRVVDYVGGVQRCGAVEDLLESPSSSREAADEMPPPEDLERDRGRLLGNAPDLAGSFFVVPRVLGGGDA